MRCGGRIVGVLALLTLAIGPATGERNGRDVRQAPDESIEPVVQEGHKEVPVPPPETPVTRESLPRSEAAPVIRGLHQSIQDSPTRYPLPFPRSRRVTRSPRVTDTRPPANRSPA